jgi:hypothetical protein
LLCHTFVFALLCFDFALLWGRREKVSHVTVSWVWGRREKGVTCNGFSGLGEKGKGVTCNGGLH